MRLHECDGLPDEDFPALDRSRKIKHFGDGGVHEYCLCEIPGMINEAEAEAEEARAGRVSSSSSSAGGAGGGARRIICVHLPNHNYFKLPISPGASGIESMHASLLLVSLTSLSFFVSLSVYLPAHPPTRLTS